MWRRLLNGIDDFTEEKLEELVKVGGTKGSERMGEVVKEVAKRLVFFTEEDCYISSCTRPQVYGRRSLFKEEVSIKGWDDDIFEMAGEYQLEEINRVAEAVGAQIAIKKVKTYRTLGPDHMSLETFEMIATIINQQEGGLDKLELKAVEVWQSCAVVQDIFLTLMKASKEWIVQSLTVGLMGNDPINEELWKVLVKKANCGQIGKLILLVDIEQVATIGEEDLKAVWEITGKLEAEFYTMSNEELVLTRTYGGGRGAHEPKATWEEVHQDVLKNIC